MRGMGCGLDWFRRALACAVIGVLLQGLPAAAEVVVIEKAQASIAPSGRSPQTGAATLPYSWDERQGAVAGQASFVLEVELADPATPSALYIPRMGNSFRVVLNGSEVARFGELPQDPYADAVHQPKFFDLPLNLVARHNVLEITIGATSARGAGLSPVVVGPRDEVWRLYSRAQAWQVSGSRVVAIVSAVLGLLALLLWLRRRDALFLYYGLGEIFWSLQTTRVLFEQAPLPWPLWGVLFTTAFHAAPALLCKFALAAIGRGDGALARGMNVLLWLALPGAVLWLVYGFLWVGPLGRAASALAALAMAVVVVRSTWRSKVLEERVLCVAVALIVACAVRDVVAMRLAPNAYEVVPWTRFAWLGFAISMAWVIAERMRKDSLALEGMNARLSQELAARDAELAAAFERERENERKTGALEERQRLVRDLHDGLGGHLVGALHMAQQGGASTEAVALQLREAVDQLRITVDSMHDSEGDIPAALAAVRYRLEPRLRAAGIQLLWDVDDLPKAAHWGVREAHHLQMLLYEAFTNMVVHSGATEARLSAHCAVDAQAVHVTLADNGRGFDSSGAGARGGKGLANMRQRAKAMGAELEIRSGVGCTQLALGIPLRS
jgi:signal transduction histidine kinase